MTTYAYPPNSDCDPESPLTTGLVIAVRDNPLAMFEGSAGAPKIQTAAYATASVDQSAIGAGAVHQGELSTSTASGSINVSALSSNSYSLTGGTYSWWTGSATTTGGTDGIQFGNNDTAAGVIGVFNADGSNAHGFYIDERYISASPPYDLGDGEVAGFVYVMLDQNGNIIGTQVAKDPTWANHGPTRITPDIYEKDGKGYQFKPNTLLKWNDVKADPVKKEEYLFALKQFSVDPVVNGIKILIDQSIKNADMNIVPHPFGVVPVGATVVLLDPMSNVVDEIVSIQQMGESAAKIIMDGYLNIGNTPLQRSGPQGILIPSVSWK